MRSCVITVARNMSEQTYEFLCERTRERFGSDLSFTKIVDDSVIGGFLMELDGTVYDMTLSTQLNSIRKAVLGKAGENG